MGKKSKFVDGSLEVFVGGKLVHSKLNGMGYVDSQRKRDAIAAAIVAALAPNPTLADPHQ